MKRLESILDVLFLLDLLLFFLAYLGKMLELGGAHAGPSLFAGFLITQFRHHEAALTLGATRHSYSSSFSSASSGSSSSVNASSS